MNYIQSQVIAAQDEIINQLTEERDALHKSAEVWHQRYQDKCLQHNDSIASYGATILELEKDAERYRFLRNTGEEYQHMRIYDSCGHLDPEFLDDAIDEAMKETKCTP